MVSEDRCTVQILNKETYMDKPRLIKLCKSQRFQLEGFINDFSEALEPSGVSGDIYANILATAGSLRRHCASALEQLEGKE